ncbi:MAG: phosphate ABC transporter permease subunit PstC, partial [Clostridia bacterium]|nr:phosphate ABC transporter permease subunit PstC [Clostridia bacterium]
MDTNQRSIIALKKNKSLAEKSARTIFTICAFIAVLAVFSITFYMLLNGTPALFKVGIKEILFGTSWKPTAAEPHYGILYIILTSIVGTFFAVLIGVPIGILTAVFVAEIADKRIAMIMKPVVELLAGIPSVVYGLLGIMILNPVMYKLEMALFKDSGTHQF